jgi:hypothetical protein
MSEQTCPECGAVLIENQTCEMVFNEFLSLEFTDPEYGQVHLLTVACYMIQHGRYTDEALLWIAKQLRDYLEKSLPAEQIRRQAAIEADQSQRTWQITRGLGDPPQAYIPWSMTIIDVAAQYRDPDSYRQLVEEWARRTLSEMQPLISR